MVERSVIITRAGGDIGEFVPVVKARGYQALAAPMLEIVPIGTTLPDISKYQALAFTSANAVRVVSRQIKVRDIPVYTVGDNTKEAALSEGWSDIVSAEGGVRDLCQLIEEAPSMKPGMGPVLHLAGVHVSGELGTGRIQVERCPVYEAVRASSLPPELMQVLGRRDVEAVLFFSPRGAETFLSLMCKYGLVETLTSIKALCLGDTVLQSVQSAKWADVQCARTPDRAGMIGLLESLKNWT